MSGVKGQGKGVPKPHLAIGYENLTREEALKGESPYMTFREAAIYLRCGSAHLYRNLHHFKPVKFGKKTLIPRANIEAYLASNPFKRVSPVRKKAA